MQLSETDTNYIAHSCVNTTSYSYDKDGNITGMTYPTGEMPAYSYDDQNRCFGLNGFSELYYQGERVSGRALGNGLSTQYTYQANNRIHQVWHHRGGNDPTFSAYPSSNVSLRFYGYAPDSQLTWSIHQPDSGDSSSSLEDGRGENYAYANDGSLTGFSLLYANTAQSEDSHGDSTANQNNFSLTPNAGGPGSYGNSYQYDASGNRQNVTQMGGSNIAYGADGENRYYGSSYDYNGNTTNSAVGWIYGYDAEGRMVDAQRQSDGYNMQFLYDGAGRLIYQGSNTTQTIFCYSGSQRIEERSATNNASLYRYFFDAPGSDSIVFREQTTGQGAGPRIYYQYDAMGNTTHVSDDSGNVVEQYLYDAYGTPFVCDKYGNGLEPVMNLGWE